MRKRVVAIVLVVLASLVMGFGPSSSVAQPTPSVQVGQPTTLGPSEIPATEAPRIAVNVTSPPGGVYNVTLLYHDFPGLNPGGLAVGDLTTYNRASMINLKTVSSNTTEYYYQMPTFANDTTVWGLVQVFTGTSAFVSSQGPNELYYVLSPKPMVELDISAYIQDVNPKSLNLTIPLFVSLYNTVSFFPVTLNGLDNGIYFTANTQQGECCWSGTNVANIYGYEGTSHLFPFDGYTYTVDFSLVGPPSYNNVTFNQVTLHPNIPLGGAVKFSPRDATEDSDDSQWVLTSNVTYVPTSGPTNSPTLDITIHLQRQSGLYELPFEIPMVALFLMLGLSVLLRRESDISSRLLLYLSVLIVTFAFLQFSTSYLSGPFIVAGYSLVVLFGLALVPGTAALTAASIFGWVPTLKRFQFWTDLLGVGAAFVLLWKEAQFQVPSYGSNGISYATYDLTKFGAFGLLVSLALLSGIILLVIARVIQRIAVKEGRSMAELMTGHESFIRYCSWIAIGSGALILAAGLVELYFNFEFGLTFVAVGLGFIAGGYAARTELILQEIRRGEISEKMAVIAGALGNSCQRVINDLRSIREIRSSVSRTQAEGLAASGRILIAEMMTKCPGEVQQAEGILNDILRRYRLRI